MNGIKFTFGSINKRVSEPIVSFDKLINITKQLFQYEESKHLIWYLDSDGDKIEISNEEDFKKILDYHKSKGESVVKLEITLRPVITDSMIENVKISESFAIYDKCNQSVRDELDYNAVSIINSIKKYEEKATQNKEENENKFTETNIETSELGTNTLIVNQVEKETQAKETNEIKSSQSINITKQLNNISQLRDEDNIILSKIEDILSSRFKEMEENFKKLIVNKKEESLKEINSEKINIINVKHKPENKFENNSHQILSSKIERNDATFNSLYCNGEFFKNEYCSSCKYEIMKNKYICVMCDDYTLCSQCESSHKDHPLLKININTKSITNMNELIQHILKKSSKKREFPIINSVKNFFSKDYFVTISSNFSPTVFAMSRGSKVYYCVNILNSGKVLIDDEITITPINNKNFLVESKIITKLNVYENKQIELLFEAPNYNGIYNLEINATVKGKPFKVEPLKLEVHVVDPDDMELRNADLYFGTCSEFMKLPDDKKIMIYKLVEEKITCLSIDDIISIMKKNDFDLASALDELTKFEEENQCYYDGSRNLNL